jgi:hypothetical protein
MKMNNKMTQPINVPVEINHADWRYSIVPDSLIDHKLIKKELDINIVEKKAYV